MQFSFAAHISSATKYNPPSRLRRATSFAKGGFSLQQDGGPSIKHRKCPKVGRLHTFNGNEGALRPFFFAWRHLGHQVYQMSTSKPVNPLRRRDWRVFHFPGHLPGVYRSVLFYIKSGDFLGFYTAFAIFYAMQEA